MKKQWKSVLHAMSFVMLLLPTVAFSQSGDGERRSSPALSSTPKPPTEPRTPSRETIERWAKETETTRAHLSQGGVPTKEMLNNLQQLANAGNARALNMLGVMYWRGSSGVPKNEDKGRQMLERAALEGEPTAMGNLALYYLGNRSQSDPLIALAWARRSADLGSNVGARAMGQMLESGWGIPQNLDEAVSWYTKAGQLGRDDLSRLKIAEAQRKQQAEVVARRALSKDTCEIASVLFGNIRLEIQRHAGNQDGHRYDFESAIVRHDDFNDPKYNAGAIRGEITVDRGGFAVRDSQKVVLGRIMPNLQIDGNDEGCAKLGKLSIQKDKPEAYSILKGNTSVGTITGRFPKNDFGVR